MPLFKGLYAGIFTKNRQFLEEYNCHDTSEVECYSGEDDAKNCCISLVERQAATDVAFGLGINAARGASELANESILIKVFIDGVLTNERYYGGSVLRHTADSHGMILEAKDLLLNQTVAQSGLSFGHTSTIILKVWKALYFTQEKVKINKHEKRLIPGQVIHKSQPGSQDTVHYVIGPIHRQQHLHKVVYKPSEQDPVAVFGWVFKAKEHIEHTLHIPRAPYGPEYKLLPLINVPRKLTIRRDLSLTEQSLTSGMDMRTMDHLAFKFLQHEVKAEVPTADECWEVVTQHVKDPVKAGMSCVLKGKKIPEDELLALVTEKLAQATTKLHVFTLRVLAYPITAFQVLELGDIHVLEAHGLEEVIGAEAEALSKYEGMVPREVVARGKEQGVFTDLQYKNISTVTAKMWTIKNIMEENYLGVQQQVIIALAEMQIKKLAEKERAALPGKDAEMAEEKKSFESQGAELEAGKDDESKKRSQEIDEGDNISDRDTAAKKIKTEDGI